MLSGAGELSGDEETAASDDEDEDEDEEEDEEEDADAGDEE